MNNVKDLVLEDVDDTSNQDLKDGCTNHKNNKHQTNDDMNSADPDMLNEIWQPLQAVLDDKLLAAFPDQSLQIQEESSNENIADSEQRRLEMMKLMEMEFPEFKMKSEEFFEEIEQWTDPEYYEGIKEAQRLNRILSEKIKREKEVKHQGILLRQKLYDELQSIKQQGRQEQQEERANTQKFLALTFVPEKSKVNDESPEYEKEKQMDSICSVFQTELNESDAISRASERNSVPELDLSSSASETSDYCKQRNTLPEMVDENGSYQHEAKHKPKKNFLKRNIQLAKDANNTVPMTANEKKRVEVLLQDIDASPDCDQDVESNFSWNSSSKSCVLGEGFTSNREDRALMSLIDSRLKNLMSEDEFNSVASTSRSTSTQRAFTSVVPPSDTEAMRTFGEKALLDTKEERDMKEKLKRIDQDLKDIFNDPLPETPVKLDEDVLLELLESCASSMSGCVSNRNATPISNPSPQSILDVEPSPSPCLQEDSSRSECSNNTSENQSISINLARLLESPPHLSEEILKRLLEDATPRSCSISTPQSQLSSSKSGSEEEYREGSSITDFAWPGNFYYTTERSSLNSSQEHFLPEISSSRSLIEVDSSS